MGWDFFFGVAATILAKITIFRNVLPYPTVVGATFTWPSGMMDFSSATSKTMLNVGLSFLRKKSNDYQLIEFNLMSKSYPVKMELALWIEL